MENLSRVVIIGSFRKHLADIGVVAQQMRNQGVQVLSPLCAEGLNPKADFVILRSDSPAKSPRNLQRDVLVKILSSNLVYLVNPDGYVGMSAAAEVGYSALVEARVLLHHAVTDFGPDVPSVLRDLLKHVPHSGVLSSTCFAEQVALARTHSWNLIETQRNAVREVLHRWIYSLSDQIEA